MESFSAVHLSGNPEQRENSDEVNQCNRIPVHPEKETSYIFAAQVS